MLVLQQMYRRKCRVSYPKNYFEKMSTLNKNWDGASLYGLMGWECWREEPLAEFSDVTKSI